MDLYIGRYTHGFTSTGTVYRYDDKHCCSLIDLYIRRYTHGSTPTGPVYTYDDKLSAV